MNCHDNSLRDMIFDYVEENLDTEATSSVTMHLAECPECRELETEYRQMIVGLRMAFENTAQEHITNDVLVTYADHPGTLPIKEKKRVELHLAMCDLCRQKIEMLQKVAQEETSQSEHTLTYWLGGTLKNIYRSLAPRPVAGFAAAAVVLVVFATIYWTVIGIDHGPRMQFITAENVNWLVEITRSGRQQPEIVEENGRINVGVKFHAFFSEERYKIQLQSQAGTVLQEKMVGKELYDGTGVAVEIETSALDPGEYRLMLIGQKLADEDNIIEVAFPFILTRN